MKTLLLASALIIILIGASCRFAVWVKTHSSPKAKDYLLIGILAAFSAGVFYCFSPRVAFLLAALVGLCVAVDFIKRKRGSPVAIE